MENPDPVNTGSEGDNEAERHPEGDLDLSEFTDIEQYLEDEEFEFNNDMHEITNADLAAGTYSILPLAIDDETLVRLDWKRRRAKNKHQ